MAAQLYMGQTPSQMAAASGVDPAEVQAEMDKWKINPDVAIGNILGRKSAGRSLAGTMTTPAPSAPPPLPSVSAQRAGGERQLPEAGGGIEGFGNVLRNVALLARQKTRPTAESVLDSYGADRPFNPQTIASAIRMDTGMRRASEDAVMKNAFKMLATEDKKNEADTKVKRDLLANMGKAGTDVSQVPPDQWAKLVSDSGLSDFEAKLIVNANLPESKQIKYSTKIEGNQLILYGVDPMTGKAVSNVTTIEGYAPPGEYLIEQSGDGKYFIYTRKDYDPSKPREEQIFVVASPKNLNKPKADGTKLSGSQIGNIRKRLEEAKGSDNYTDTSVYLQVAQELSGPLQDDLFKQFAPKAWLNPKDATAISLYGVAPKEEPKSDAEELQAMIDFANKLKTEKAKKNK